MTEAREFEAIGVGKGDEVVDAVLAEALGRVGAVTEQIRFHNPDDPATVEFPQPPTGLRSAVSKAAMVTLAAQAAEIGAGKSTSKVVPSSVNQDAIDRWAAAYSRGMNEGNGE